MTTRASGKARAPISSHPAFPAIVALWFAALLGVGSMVLPVVLFEKLIDATGIASVLPAAQPPLGATARIFVALVCAVLGVVAGLTIARKVVTHAAPQPRKRGAVANRQPAKRPFSARDELDPDDFDGDLHADAGIPVGRRRSLAVTDENARSDFLEAAPLPGPYAYTAPTLDAEMLDLVHFPVEAGEEEAAPQVGDAFAGEEPHCEPERRQVFQAAEPEVAEPVVSAVSEPEALEASMADSEFAESPALHAQPAAFERAKPAPLPSEARENLADRPLRELAIAELVERFALSLERRSQSEDEEALELPQLKSARNARVVEAVPDPAPEPAPEQSAGAPSIPAALNPFERQPAAEPAFQQAPPAQSIPAALRPVGFDEYDEADDEQQDALISDLTLSLDQAERPFARPAQAPIELDDADDEPEAEAEADDGEEAGEGYSSLLAMKSPFGASREFVRIEEDEPEPGDIEPVVVFPGQQQQQRRAAPASDGPSRDPLSQPRIPQAGFRPFDGPAPGQQVAHAEFSSSAMPTRPADKRANPAQTERALRDALEKLQRMSGAA